MRFDAKVQESVAVDLQEALREGIARNPQVQLAEVNKSIAMTLSDQGRVQLRPDVSANAVMSKKQTNSLFGYESASDAINRTFSPDSTSQTYSLNYTRPWDNRAAKAGFVQAESRLRQQEILLEQTRRSVSSQIALAVTNLQSAEQRTGIAKQSRDLAEKVYSRAEKQRSLGVVSDFEVIAKSIDLLNADLDYQTALLGRKISEAAVYAAIGTLAQRYGEGSRQ
jgi:outer membrane protein TolC